MPDVFPPKIRPVVPFIVPKTNPLKEEMGLGYRTLGDRKPFKMRYVFIYNSSISGMEVTGAHFHKLKFINSDITKLKLHGMSTSYISFFNSQINSLDIKTSRLQAFNFNNATIHDIDFNNMRLSGMTSFVNTTIITKVGRKSIFSGVKFSYADLRGINWVIKDTREKYIKIDKPSMQISSIAFDRLDYNEKRAFKKLTEEYNLEGSDKIKEICKILQAGENLHLTYRKEEHRCGHEILPDKGRTHRTPRDNDDTIPSKRTSPETLQERYERFRFRQ